MSEPAEQLDKAWFGLDLDAEHSAAQARDLLPTLGGQPRLQTVALCVLAWYSGSHGADLELALQQARQAEAAARLAEAADLLPRVHLACAMVLGALGDRAGRFEQLETARRCSAEQGDAYHEMLALHDLGLGFEQPELLELALARARSLPQPGVGIIANLLHSVAPRLAAGDVETARARSEEAWQRARQGPADPRWQVEALRILATTQARAGQRARALASLTLLEQQATVRPALLLLTRARVLAASGRRRQAMAAYQDCLATADRPRLLLDAARELAPLYAHAGCWRKAYECQLRIDTLRSQMQHEDNERRLRGLEVQHRLALREQQLEQERVRHRELADHVARLEAAHREITELSLRDALTGQYNRRHADAELARALSRVQRGDDQLALALLDIDHFKAVNDRHGHAVGDAVLQQVARRVAGELRSADLLARYGGEEFVLLLQGAAPAAARAACERIRSAIAAGPWSDVAQGLAVTASFGLVQARKDEDAPALLQRADALLYQAKRSGRNRVVADDGP